MQEEAFLDSKTSPHPLVLALLVRPAECLVVTPLHLRLAQRSVLVAQPLSVAV